MNTHTHPNRLTIRNRILAASFCAVSALGVSDSQAGLIAYDGLKVGGDGYTSGNLGGQTPATLGFTGAWNTPLLFGSGSAEVNSASALTYSGVTTDNTGGVGTTGFGVRANRFLANPFTATTAGTFYFSYLTQVNNLNKDYVGLELQSGANGDGAERSLQAGFNNDIAPNGGSTWGIRVNNENVASSGVAATANETVLFVMKFTLSAANLSDSITLWVNPSDLASEAASGPGTTVSGVNFLADRVTFANFGNTGGKFDELRIGTTFTDATTAAVPEPGTVALLTAGAGTMLLRARRGNRLPAA
jgi:hypothetical protein